MSGTILDGFSTGEVVLDGDEYKWQVAVANIPGVFDQLIDVVNKNISIQFDNGRIKDDKYADVYIAGLNTAVSQSLSYILEKFSKEYTAGSCTKNDSELTRLRELRDLLFAISNTVEYYSEYHNYYKAAKLLEDVSFCSICSSFLKNVKTNCNCNG